MVDSASLPNVLLIAGSLRKQSLNRQLAEQAAAVIGDRAHTELLEWADVPVFNQDIEFPAPQPVTRVRKAVKEADALWVVTPEYNHGVPGPLKNLVDWLSRPTEDGGEGVIVGKTVTFSSVAGSSRPLLAGRMAPHPRLPETAGRSRQLYRRKLRPRPVHQQRAQTFKNGPRIA